MRSLLTGIAIVAISAGAAYAKEGNPVQGIGVSVEQSPGGIMMPSADCKLPKGTLVKVGSKWICKITASSSVKVNPNTTVKPAGVTGDPPGGMGVSVEAAGQLKATTKSTAKPK